MWIIYKYNKKVRFDPHNYYGVIVFGDPVTSGVQEEKPDARPKCGYKIEEKLADGGSTRRPCGSEDRVFNVSGNGTYSGRERTTPVCGKHLGEVWRDWQVREAIPVDLPTRR